jgi:hypothetical protein
VFYPALGITEALVVHASKWLDGSLPFPRLNPIHLLLALWTAYPLGLIHALDRMADRALEAFRPALGADQADVGALRRALTTMPAWPVLLASLFGVPFLWLARFLSPSLFPASLTSGPGGVLWMTLANLNFALLGALIYHTLRQLKLVSDIYAKTQKINLFIPEPLYAFSGLSAMTGAGWVLLLYGTISVFPAILTSGLAIGLLAFMFTLSGAAFLLPLLGIHSKIVAAKRALLAEVGQRTQSAVQEVYRLLDQKDVDAVGKATLPLNSLIALRGEVVHLPTWPWRPGTLTGFISALLIPLVIFLLQGFLARWVGL